MDIILLIVGSLFLLAGIVGLIEFMTPKKRRAMKRSGWYGTLLIMIPFLIITGIITILMALEVIS